eukprot:TRINITY_DN6460_c0_g1_i6.p1 TRINITY_DN6460_c0_g1~~TRINITY_DN6460_c0_g1_i6.p1  ORF type:complete len:373 (-),score=33.57 TRINITY_DN6460_c0_g1_i6:208-1326(-)
MASPSTSDSETFSGSDRGHHRDTTTVPEEVGLSSAALDKLSDWQRKIVDQQRLPGTHIMVARHGKIAYNYTTGYQNVEKRTPLAQDSIYRMYSMTKPVASAGLMMLMEEGKILLSDPIHLYLGSSWKKENMSIFVDGSYEDGAYASVPCQRSITVEHLLTHTSGLSYGFDSAGAAVQLDKIYTDKLPPPADFREAGSLATYIERLSKLPLLFQPGKCWHYSLATDVIGRIIEVISGQPLGVFLKERIFDPLSMHDTWFAVPPEERHRFCDVYMRAGQPPGEPPQLESSKVSEMDALGKSMNENAGLVNLTEDTDNKGNHLKDPSTPDFLHSGGGGLAGTCTDYIRFAQCILNGGVLEGQRILGRKTGGCCAV